MLFSTKKVFIASAVSRPTHPIREWMHRFVVLQVFQFESSKLYNIRLCLSIYPSIHPLTHPYHIDVCLLYMHEYVCICVCVIFVYIVFLKKCIVRA